MTALVTLLTVAVALLGILVVGLLRSHAEVLRALHQLGVVDGVDPARAGPVRGSTVDGVPDGRDPSAPAAGNAVPSDVIGVTPEGETARVALVGTRHTTLLAFLTTGCVTCAAVWRDIASDRPSRAGEQVVIVTRGPEMESPAAVARLAPPDVTVIQSTETWDAYGIAGAPYFMIVDGERGIIAGEGSALAWGQVRDLLGRAAADREHAGPRRSRRELLTGHRREEMADRKLRAAGILPGDPSLFPVGEPVDGNAEG